MGFRFRLGFLTFGRSGTRLSFGGGGIGISIPITGKGRSFGRIGIGPFTWYGQSHEDVPLRPSQEGSASRLALRSEEALAIEAFREDQLFLQRLSKAGMPWRGVQERLKKELSSDLRAADRIAFNLVPEAMREAFGEQGIGWDTQKRPSKDGSGVTTWIVVK